MHAVINPICPLCNNHRHHPAHRANDCARKLQARYADVNANRVPVPSPILPLREVKRKPNNHPLCREMRSRAAG